MKELFLQTQQIYQDNFMVSEKIMSDGLNVKLGGDSELVFSDNLAKMLYT